MSTELDFFKRDLLSFRENVLELEVAMARKGFDKASEEKAFIESMPSTSLLLASNLLAKDVARRKRSIYNQHLTVASRILDNFNEHFREYLE